MLLLLHDIVTLTFDLLNLNSSRNVFNCVSLLSLQLTANSNTSCGAYCACAVSRILWEETRDWIRIKFAQTYISTI